MGSPAANSLLGGPQGQEGAAHDIAVSQALVDVIVAKAEGNLLAKLEKMVHLHQGEKEGQSKQGWRGATLCQSPALRSALLTSYVMTTKTGVTTLSMKRPPSPMATRSSSSPLSPERG